MRPEANQQIAPALTPDSGALLPRPARDGPAILREAWERGVVLAGLCDGVAPGVATEDGVGLHFVDRRLAAVVASREGPRAYRVGMAGDRVVKAPLRRPSSAATTLSAPRSPPGAIPSTYARARRRAVTPATSGVTPISDGPTSGGR